jgi:hypothetical protein
LENFRWELANDLDSGVKIVFENGSMAWLNGEKVEIVHSKANFTVDSGATFGFDSTENFAISASVDNKIVQVSTFSNHMDRKKAELDFENIFFSPIVNLAVDTILDANTVVLKGRL